MLGRQQIAGIPTAISELFKNAHDAYADNVEVDFYRTDGLFVLRDNGVGMSLAEFDSRWLTLGTESKVSSRSGLKPPPVDPSKPRRPILGEKGIGRLAIAAIGPQVLILTRSKTLTGDASVVGAFINWGMFRLPGVDLEQIVVPVRTFADVLPAAKEVREMVSEVRANLTKLKRFAEEGAAIEINQQLDGFEANPRELAGFLGNPSLLDGGHGTHFYIQPSDESIPPAIDGQGDPDDVAPPLLKALVGFTNTMTPDHTAPVIKAAFRDHKTEDIADDLIGESEFFSPSEFHEADHHIQGRFDEFGQFAGTVTVYGEPTAGHVVPWSAGGMRTECGAFRINLAVVQGNARESTMPMDDWLRVVRKLNRYGGLYIYRDGIRVLPYGNNDYDFLDIERNRTKSASYYYFSYRRIFGIIEIDRAGNPALQEKAGREGFRENKAYRQFREILKNFFVQIAADFFREGGTQADRFVERKAELDRIERARREREKQITARRSAFRERLESVFVAIGEGAPATDVASVLDDARKQARVAVAMRDRSRAAVALIDLETLTRARLAETRERYRVVPPRGVGLPQAVRRDFDAYRNEYDRVVEQVFEPASLEAENLFTDAASNARIAIDRRVRFERALNELTAQTRKTSQNDGHEVRSTVDDVQSRATALVRERVAVVDSVVKDVLSRAARIDVATLDDDRFVAERRALETEIEQAGEREHRALGSVVDQLRAIAWPTSIEDDQVVTQLDLTEAAEEELLALRERSEADLELAQLGMAIQVVNHEFDATIKSVRRSLRELKAWADANEDLEVVYGNIRRSFDHLDGYLTLFTPLQRRLYRKPVRLTGAEVFKFLQELFAERLRRHDVALEATSRFKRFGFSGYPSTFYPVFVNLVDNGVFWLRQSAKPRIIRLDVDKERMVVANSGPPIAARDRQAIFELGFTRKPGGRGLGLHISRQVLEKEGYRLDLVEPPSGFGVAFRIEAAPDEDDALRQRPSESR
jgi:signal transduction histidine kinase